MKRPIARRCIPVMLALAIVAGLFTVCFGASAATKDLKLKTFYAADLAEAAQRAGTVNKHGTSIFTTYQDTIGRVSLNPGNYLLHSMNVPYQDIEVNGRKALATGDTVRLTVWLAADDIYMDGDLCQIEFLLNGNGPDYETDLVVGYDEYMTQETLVHPEYGYEYKVFTYDVLLSGDAWDNPANGSVETGGGTDVAQTRIKGMNEAAVTVYYVSLRNMETEQVLLDLDGVAIGGRTGVDGYFANVYPDGGQVSGIASYMGQYPGSRNNSEPYCYNAHGFDHKGNYALLMDSLGAQLAAGDYALGFRMKTLEALGTTDKCLYSVWDGETKLAECNVTQDMVKNAGGAGGGYCTIRVPFTVPESSDGHNITFKIQLYDSNDYGLSQVALYQVIDADTPVPAEAKAVIDAISGLDLADAQGIANARAAYDALSDLNKAWVGDEMADKLASLEKGRTAIAAVMDAIAGLGDKAELNDTNYTQKKQQLEAAEKLYADYVKSNGQEAADRFITNAQALTEYRTAYNEAEQTAKNKAKEAAVQKAIDAIAAIGGADEINSENVDAKQALVDAADAALKELTDAYGQEALSEVTNSADLTAAKDKIAEIIAQPEYVLGDINNDESIDAADALMALQHSVKLITLNETQFSAANVDGNEAVDASDALMILQCSVNLIKPEDFPAAKK